MEIAPRITKQPGKRGGRPCVRGTRIAVADVLELLASGMTHAEILEDYPSLEEDDFAAVLRFAASQMGSDVDAAE